MRMYIYVCLYVHVHLCVFFVYICTWHVSTKQVVLCNKYPYTVTDMLPTSQIDRCLLSGNTRESGNTPKYS